mgnify:CR=1 FL=1
MSQVVNVVCSKRMPSEKIICLDFNEWICECHVGPSSSILALKATVKCQWTKHLIQLIAQHEKVPFGHNS